MERAKLDIATLDKQIEEQTRLANSLLSLYSEGTIIKEQFKLQNDAIAEMITALMAQREEALSEQGKITVNANSEGESIRAVRELLEIDTNDWTNGAMKKVINRIAVDMVNSEVEISYNYAI